MSDPQVFHVSLPWGVSDHIEPGQYVWYSEYLTLQTELAALTRKLAEREAEIATLNQQAQSFADQAVHWRTECDVAGIELTQLRALRDRLVALKQRGVIPRDDFLAIIARAEELAKEYPCSPGKRTSVRWT